MRIPKIIDIEVDDDDDEVEDEDEDEEEIRVEDFIDVEQWSSIAKTFGGGPRVKRGGGGKREQRRQAEPMAICKESLASIS